MDCKNDEMERKREKALLYYAQNGIPKLLEKLLNAMFYDNPDDIFAYLANNFQKLAKASTFSKIESRLILSAQNGRAIKILVYYTVNAKDEIITQLNMSFNALSNLCDVEEKIVMDWINGNFNLSIQGCSDLKTQIEYDNYITEITNNLPLEFLIQPKSIMTVAEAKKTELRKSKTGDVNGSVLEEHNKKVWHLLVKSIICWGLSTAMLSANASLSQCPLHIQFRRLCQNSVDKTQTFDFLITIFQNSKAAPSKVNLCSEVGVVVPATGNFKPMVNLVQILFENGEKILRSKSGMSSLLTNEKGAFLTTNYEKLDQLLETIQDIISSSVTLSEGNIRCFVSFDLSDIYDPDKGKYEFAKNMVKSSDDMVEMYIDLMKKFPNLNVLIDPFYSEDNAPLTRLASRQVESSVSSSLFISSNGLNITDFTSSESQAVCGFVLQPQLAGSVSDFIALQKSLEKMKINAIMDISASDVNDNHLIDMCIGCQTPMIKLGGPMRGEKVEFFNRLLDIDFEMRKCGEEDDISSDDKSID